MNITLEGNPISTNQLYRRHGHILHMSNEGRRMKESYQWQAKIQYGAFPALTGALEATVSIFFKDKRRRDWDNWHKLSMDALTGIVYKDDSQIKKATVEMWMDKENPRIEIKILELTVLK